MLSRANIRQLFVFIAILALASLQFLQIGSVKSEKQIPEIGLVAVLVDETTWNDRNKYQGLSQENSSVSTATLAFRVKRLAEEIQQSLPQTKTTIITLSENESPMRIANTLEKLYREGDGTKNEVNRLIGTIIVGDIPLPVVKKQQNHFVSVFPYTDFDDKLYVFNEKTSAFEFNNRVKNPQQEIWHGVITPPKKGEEGKKMLATYLDKNHLYRKGDAKYGTFENALFYGDIKREEKSLNELSYQNYKNLLEYQEEKVYKRYTKELAEKLHKKSMKAAFGFGDGFDNDGDGKIDEDPINGFDDDGDGEDKSPTQNGFKIADNIDNDGDGIIDEGIDEDDGEAYKKIDNDHDGKTDEDTASDNDADNDGKTDEDGPGDMNNDGCPGICFQDDDADSKDIDGDNYPTGYEKEFGSTNGKKTDPRDPEDYPYVTQFPLFKIPRFDIPTTIENPNYPKNKRGYWVDEWPQKSDRRCFDANGVFHPEWDDDEDGFCNEDGTKDNDNDNDGKTDEDIAVAGNENQGVSFDKLPDVMSRIAIDNFLKEYPQLFEKYLSQMNKYVGYTGRWGRMMNNVDDFTGLIGKKDIANRNYFLYLNLALERAIDEVITQKKVAAEIPLISSAKILGSTARIENAGGNVITTISQAPATEFVYGNDFFVNGVARGKITSAIDCTLFRGTRSTEAPGSKQVMFNQVFNAAPPPNPDYKPGDDPSKKNKETHKDSSGYCNNNMVGFTGACVPEDSNDPVFDPRGSKRIENFFASAADYRSCFDLKEKKNYFDEYKNGAKKGVEKYRRLVNAYLDYKKDLAECSAKNPKNPENCKIPPKVAPEGDSVTPKMSDKYHKTESIVIFNREGVVITLADAAKAAGIDPTDIFAVNTWLFDGSNPSQTRSIEVKNPLPNNKKVKSIKITVGDRKVFQQLGAPPKTISTLIKHKAPFSFDKIDPKNPTQADKAILAQQTSPSVDLPVDSPRYASFKNKNDGALTKFIYPNLFKAKSPQEAQLLVEVAKNQLVRLTKDPADGKKITDIIVEQAKDGRLQDAYTWKTSNIDQKHEYVFTHYLSGKNNPFVAQQKNGYEAAYLVVNGKNNELEFAINPEKPAEDEDEDAAFTFPQKKIIHTPTKKKQQTTKNENDIGVFFLAWFGHLAEWAASLSYDPGVKLVCQFEDPDDELVNDKIAAALDSDRDGIPDYLDSSPENPDDDNDGIPDGVRETKKLVIRAEPQTLTANGKATTRIIVEARNAKDTVNRLDSFTQVQLQLPKNSVATLASEPTANLIGGKAEFIIQATETKGTVRLSSKAINIKRNLISNTLNIISHDTLLQTASYTKNNQAPPAGQTRKEQLQNVLVKNKAGTVLARYTAENGSFESVHPGYEIQVVAAEKKDPVRIMLIEKISQKKVAALMYVPKEDLLYEDSSSTSYANFNTFRGVRVKVLERSFPFKVEKRPNWIEFFKQSQKIAAIHSSGRIFTQAGATLELKPLADSSEYQTLVIRSDDGVSLAEILVVTDFENITLLKDEASQKVHLSLLQKNRGAPLGYSIAKAASTKFDQDGDGLSDLEELVIGTDLKKSDTDGDSFSDKEEVATGFDPKRVNKEKLFTDLDTNHEAFDSVLTLYLRGVIKGFDDRTFKPNANITREEFLKVNFGSVCIDCTRFSETIKRRINQSYAPQKFPDQDIDPALEFCVAKAKVDAIVSGYKGGDAKGFYLPKQSISRVEASKIIMSTANIPAGFVDVKDKPWYYAIVIGAQKAKIFPPNRFSEIDTGTEQSFRTWFDNQINSSGPFKAWLEGPITRGEFAMMANQVLGINDCKQPDTDGDGLSDAEETGQYATDPKKPDTDDGGVNDYIEVTNNMKPLDANDDKNFVRGDGSGDSDGDGVSDAEEKKYGFNPNKKDADGDNDKDQLTNIEERRIGTNPDDPDTDDGGINDYDEVRLLKTDPLDKSDDALGELNVKTSIISAYLEYETVDIEPIAEIENRAQAKTYTEQILADGKSELFVASLSKNLAGETQQDDFSSTIRFVPLNGSEKFGAFKKAVVRNQAGVAENIFVPTTKAGYFTYRTEDTATGVQSLESSIYVYPGKPAKLSFSTASTKMKADKDSSMQVAIQLYDQHNNLADYGTHLVTIVGTGEGAIIAEDIDATKPGIQLQSQDGVVSFRVKSTGKIGKFNVTAQYEKTQAVLPLEMVEGLQIDIVPVKKSLTADGRDTTVVQFFIKDKKNVPVTDFNGSIAITVFPQNSASLNTNKIVITQGKGSAVLSATSQSQKIVIGAIGPLLDSAQHTYEILPESRASYMQLITDQKTVIADGKTPITITAKVFDQYDNHIQNLSSGTLKVRPTNATKQFSSFPKGTTANITNGIARFTVQPTEITGVLNLVVEGEKLPPATISVKSVKRITAETFYKNPSHNFHTTLLGVAGGKTEQEDYIGGSIIFSGKSLTAHTLTHETESFEEVARISPTLMVTPVDEASAEVEMFPEKNHSPSLIIRDPKTGVQLGRAFVHMKDAVIQKVENLPINPSKKTGVLIHTKQEKVTLVENRITDGENPVIAIKKNGSIEVLTPNIIMRQSSQAQFAIDILSTEKGQLATILYHINGSTVKRIKPGINVASQGYYVEIAESIDPFMAQTMFLSNSSKGKKGIRIVDTRFPRKGNDLPGVTADSLEDAKDVFGIGFGKGNKHMLLLAGGNTIGEAAKPNASDIGIVLGDPTLKLPSKNMASKTGFTKDIGKQLLAGDTEIKSISSIDYNSDKLDDVLVAYESGAIVLLERTIGAQPFINRGKILELTNGINAIDTGDIDKDGFEDLIIASTNSCIVGEVCVYWYKNNDGNFVRKNLKLDTDQNIFTVKVADINGDTYPEIITSDFKNDIKIFYNKKGTVDTKGQLLGRMALTINEQENLITSVMTSYTQMPQKTGNLFLDRHFRDIEFTEIVDPATPQEIKKLPKTDTFKVSIDKKQQSAAVNGIFVLGSEELKTSTKKAQDLNKGALENGDIVRYTITLNNTSNKNLTNVFINDIVPNGASVNKKSITCTNCGAKKIRIQDSSSETRPFVISNIEIPAQGSRTIQYEMVYSMKELPKYTISLVKDLPDFPVKDDLWDIALKPEKNSSGRVLYFYTEQKNQDGTVAFKRLISTPKKPKLPKTPFTDEKGNIDFGKIDKNGIPEKVGAQLNVLNRDADGDGLPDLWDTFSGDLSNFTFDVSKFSNEMNKVLDDVGNFMNNIMNFLNCSEGCFPLPVSMSHLAPGNYNFMGMPITFDSGTPLFGAAVPNPPFVCFGQQCYASTAFRLYISPIVPPASIGFSLCVGPYGGGQCFSFVLDLLSVSGLCAAIEQAFDDLMAAAKDAVSSVSKTIFMAGSGTASMTKDDRENAFGIQDPNFGGSTVNAGKEVNYALSGFPAPVTDWFRKQADEIIDTLTDFPDFYLILPDFVKAVQPTVELENGVQNFRDVLTVINSIPLISIQTKRVEIKVPTVSLAQMQAWIADAEQWVDDLKNQTKLSSKGIVPRVQIQLEKVIFQVEQNMNTLNEYKRMFRKIRDLRRIQSKYISQIVCYLDEIQNMLVGFLRVNQQRIKAWQFAIKDAKEKFLEWSAILEIPVTYHESCDNCKSERFTLTEMISKLFVVIPTPPILQLPRLPDIVLDLSHINTGVEIVWPELVFRPQPLNLPQLPRIDLPAFNVQAQLDLGKNIPDIPVLPPPPEFADLPLFKLPPLPVVNLPVIPKPPVVPSLPIALKGTLKGLKISTQILCVFKSNFIPVSEFTLKSKLENLAARGVEPVLGIDKLFKFQIPNITYDFVERVEARTKINFRFKTDHIYKFTKQFADVANKEVDGVIGIYNKYSGQFADVLQGIINTPTRLLEENVDTNINIDFNQLINQTPQSREDAMHLNQIRKYLHESVSIINEWNAAQPEMPTELTSGATISYLNADDPRLNRHITTETSYHALGVEGENLKNIVAAKNALIAYNNALQEGTTDMFADRMIAEQTTRLHAALSPFERTTDATKNNGTHIVKLTLNEESAAVRNSIEHRLLAQAQPRNERIPDPKTATRPNLLAHAQNNIGFQGIRVYNPLLNVNERLLEYTEEADEKMLLLPMDIDNDTDDDLIYTIGADVFLKENQTFTPKQQTYRGTPEVRKLADIVPATKSIESFDVAAIGNRDISVRWNATKTAFGYHIKLYDTIRSAAHQTTNPKEHHLVLTADKKYAITDIDGTVTLKGPRRLVLDSSSPPTELSAGMKIHAQENVEITFGNDDDAVDPVKIAMKTGEVKELTTALLDAESRATTVSGKVIIVMPGGPIDSQTPQDAWPITLEDTFTIAKGGALEAKLEERSIRIEGPAIVKTTELEEPDEPIANLALENGNYYANISALSKDAAGIQSETKLLAPQSCADISAPTANAGPSTRQAILFSKITIDASNSFDADSVITSYAFDLDTEKDTNGDGILDNDIDYAKDIDEKVDSDFDGNPANDRSDPKVTIGPFTELKDRKIAVIIRDEVGNIAKQHITINVVVPKISLEQRVEENGVAGFIAPEAKDVPISLLRRRDNGPWQEVITKDANANGQYLTKENGSYLVKDLVTKQEREIRNQQNKAVAKLSPKTGNVVITDAAYKVLVFPTEKTTPTRIEIRDPKGKILSTTYLVTNGNIDATIHESSFEFTKEKTAPLSGVHVRKQTKRYGISFIPGSDARFGGGVRVTKSNKDAAVIMSDGNIYIFDPSVKLRLKKALASDDPLVIVMHDAVGVIAEIFVAVDLETGVQFKNERTGIPNVQPYTPKTISSNNDSDFDGLPDSYEVLNELNPENAQDAKEDQDNDGLTALEEYGIGTKPQNADTDGDGKNDGDEVKNGTNPLQKDQGAFFDDVPQDNRRFDDIMKLKKYDIVEGFKENNKNLYKPLQTVKRSEFTKIVLKMLCIEPRPDAYIPPPVFADVRLKAQGDPWYFDEIKEARLRNFITGYLEEIDAGTNLPYFKPDQTINRAEAAKIILEILDKEGIIRIKQLRPKEGEIWYAPFMRAATNLMPYLVNPETKLKNNFILTDLEAEVPDKLVTRGEMATIASRVLDARNCYLDDTNKNNVPDAWEKKNNIDNVNLDHDQDGLTSAFEHRIGTNPLDPDTDRGGIKDGIEYNRGTNPLNAADDLVKDSDREGLTDIEELLVYGTDPLNPDTDGGGVDDKTEVVNGTNPLLKEDDYDDDLDGLLTDEERKIYFTDPKNPDTDAGGVGDGLEVSRGTDPLDKSDDQVRPKLSEGINFTLPECVTCPCELYVTDPSDIRPGDEFMSALYDKKRKKIFTQSKVLKIK